MVSLTGSGIGPVSVNPTSLTFSKQQIGTTSPPKTVTIPDNQMTALTINSMSTYGDFAQTNTCPNSLAAGASCTVSVTFTPSQSGTRAATLIVTHNATNSPQVVDLAGTGE